MSFTITGAHIENTVKLHAMWLDGEQDGTRANLSGMNLSRADLSGMNLSRADLSGMNLSRANLSWAILSEADLSRTKLSEAILYRANLSKADLSEADLPNYSIVPEEGSFVAFKSVRDGILKLEIPADAKRTSSLVGRECRASHVKVLEGSGVSEKGGVYKEGEFYYPDEYDGDIRVECTHGVHFFMTRREAERWAKW